MITPYSIAEKFIGLTEVPGKDSNAQIISMLTLDADWPTGDDVPWCSAFVNYVCWLAGVSRSKKLNARSWLDVGKAVPVQFAMAGYDVAILSRGSNPAQGHVGFYHNHDKDNIYLLGGNQADSVNITGFPLARLLGVRRLT